MTLPTDCGDILKTASPPSKMVRTYVLPLIKISAFAATSPVIVSDVDVWSGADNTGASGAVTSSVVSALTIVEGAIPPNASVPARKSAAYFGCFIISRVPLKNNDNRLQIYYNLSFLKRVHNFF